MTENRSQAAASGWKLALPPFLVLLAFGLFIGVRGVPHATTLRQALKDVEAARAAAISPEEALRLAQQQEELTAQIASARTRLEHRQKEARVYAGGDVDPARRLELMNAMHDCFERANLVLTVEQALGNEQDVALTGSMRRAMGRLLTSIKASEVEAVSSKPRNPAMMSPEAFFAAQEAQQGSAEIVAPPPALRELELHGSYSDMLAALRQICNECGQTSVVSVHLERPAARGKQTPMRTWKLLVNVQPLPSAAVPPTDERIALDQGP